jgi:hypothetical protein
VEESKTTAEEAITVSKLLFLKKKSEVLQRRSYNAVTLHTYGDREEINKKR